MLVIVLSLLLRFTASDYPFGIYKPGRECMHVPDSMVYTSLTANNEDVRCFYNRNGKT